MKSFIEISDCVEKKNKKKKREKENVKSIEWWSGDYCKRVSY